MALAYYLGDEISAAGFRLAGVKTRVPATGEETDALTAACAEAKLVLVSAAVAAHIDDAALSRALAALSPLTLLVPDPAGKVELPDIASRLRRQLGLEP
jgi:vacuolar-type H+-ATPase subunit F/Vma7